MGDLQCWTNVAVIGILWATVPIRGGGICWKLAQFATDLYQIWRSCSSFASSSDAMNFVGESVMVTTEEEGISSCCCIVTGMGCKINRWWLDVVTGDDCQQRK